MSIRQKVGIIFLAFQIVLILYARFVPERFFCWAPFDEHSYLNVSVAINDKQLTKKEIESRYRYTSEGWEPRSVHNVFSIIKQYETTYGKKDSATVKVKYSINGNEVRLWTLKQ